MAVVTRVMLRVSRLPRTVRRWTGMAGSPRLAAIRKMACGAWQWAMPGQADPVTGRLAGVSQPLAEPAHLPPATERQVRSHAAELVELAARHGMTALAFASPGRLRGHLADDRDLFDMFEFQRAAADLLGAEVTVYSDGALRNQHVSPDLVAATP